MKRMLSVILLLGMLLSLASCGETTTPPKVPDVPGVETVIPQSPVQTEPTGDETDDSATSPDSTIPEAPGTPSPAPLQILLDSHYDSEYTEDFIQLCSAAWDNLLLGSDSAAVFPALDTSLLEFRAEAFEYNEQFLNDMLPLAKEAAAISGEYFYGFTGNSDYFVQRADDRILSVRIDEDEFTGGVHPNYWVVGLNLDPATGQSLTPSDVLTNTADLPAILTQKIQTKYPFDLFDDLLDTLTGYSMDAYTWTMDYQGITFYFSPYEIASYAAGLLTVTIWFDEMPELFVEKYTSAPVDGWAKMLPFYYEVEVDLDRKDGARDSLYLSTYEEEDTALNLYITRNDAQQQLDAGYGYSMKSLLVCLGQPGQERYFLYVETTGNNDYTSLYVYDLNGDAVTLACELSNAGFTGVFDETVGKYGTWYEEVPTTPAALTLDSTLQILGTWTGSRTYVADPATGILQPLTNHYVLAENTLVSAVDLQVTLLTNQEPVTLPAGTSFQFLRTDGESYAEFKLEDGRECRIDIVREDYTPLINGIPEWDCFIDLIYAG